MPWRAVLRDTVRIFSRHDGRMLAGATAFFAMVSVTPLLLIALVVAGAVADAHAARRELLHGLRVWLGEDGARALAAMLANVHASRSGAEVTAISVAVILWGATRLFSHLQRALDHLWGVRMRDQKALRDKALKQLRRRAVAFAMVVFCGAALVASMTLRTALVATERVLGAPASTRWHVVDHLLALGAVSALFAVVFRVLPHVRITWRDALTGSAVTTALFALGRYAVAAYLGRKSLDSAFGAAGSVVLLMLWTYYSAQIFFFGAAFIAARAKHAGRALTPTDDAVALREDGGGDDD
jgi:membrane protein